MVHHARGREALPRSAKRQVVMGVQGGLCMHAAAMLVMTTERYAAEVTIACEGREVSAQSLLALVLLDVGWGKTVTITADGSQAEEAAAAIAALFAADFAPRRKAEATSAPPEERLLRAG